MPNSSDVQACLREGTPEKRSRTEHFQSRRDGVLRECEAAPNGAGSCDFLSPPQRPDELGRLGSYRALEILGFGGMGMVFRAEDTVLRRQIALKVMLPSVAAAPTGKARFLREARTAASIKHDHIVTIYQVHEENGVPFIAMELLEGESLEKRLTRDRKLTAAQIVHIGKEMAQGLAAAHDVGLVHRDIKPANIWLESQRRAGDLEMESSSASQVRVKILDFGLACDTQNDSQLTRKGCIVGTAAFMSPEQARGRVPDARSDLFSLGSVLYVMCTGRQPFTGKDQVSTLVSVVSSTPDDLCQLDPKLPAELTDLVMQLLEKRPSQRPQSAHEVAKRLAVLEKKPVLSRRNVETRVARNRSLKTDAVKRRLLQAESSSSEQPAPFRRTGVFMTLAVIVALLAGGGAWLAATMVRPEPIAEPQPQEPRPVEPRPVEPRPVEPRPQIATGTAVFKTAEKNVQLKLSSVDKMVTIVDLSDLKMSKVITLKVGKYDMELLNAKEGFKLRSSYFTILEGRQQEIEVLVERPVEKTVAPHPDHSSSSKHSNPLNKLNQLIKGGKK